MEGLCVGWTFVVGSLEHIYNIWKATLIVLFGTINSPHLHCHGEMGLLEYLTLFPDSPQPLRRPIDNLELM